MAFFSYIFPSSTLGKTALTDFIFDSLETAKPDIKDINHKQDFRNGTFVTLKRKYLSKPLQSERNWTNQIACSD